ncbi:MAG: hypothetical protein HFE97_12085 [Oscillospiraceae bacterium]|nr:hypothetical protein [Oscillospiraceae bacterium]
MKKRVVAALCVLAFCLSLLPALAAGSQTEVIHLAVNDHFFDREFNLSTMPVSIGNVIYVPYMVFDSSAAGVDFHISYSQSRGGGEYTLTLYSLQGRLTFDLVRGTAVGESGEQLNMSAILRNGRPFIPIQAVCTYFNRLAGETVIQYVYTSTDYGSLVRLRNGDAVLSDSAFKSSAMGSMRIRYERYLQSLIPTPAASPSPSPSPANPTVPTTAVTPLPTPAPPSPPSVPPAVVTAAIPSPTQTEPAETPEPDEKELQVYLAFRCGMDSRVEQLLSILSNRGITALFLFEPEQLAEQADQVRQVVGGGHSLGLIVSGNDPETLLAALDAGNAQLERLAWTRTRIAMVSGGRQRTINQLTEQGWHCWQDNLSPTSSPSNTLPARILNALDRQQTVARITLDGGSATLSALPRILSQLLEEKCRILAPLESDF